MSEASEDCLRFKHHKSLTSDELLWGMLNEAVFKEAAATQYTRGCSRRIKWRILANAFRCSIAKVDV